MADILLKRSSTADKRPDPINLQNGELALNFNAGSGNVFYKNSGGCLGIVGAATVSNTAPNTSPAGYAGNSVGELWFNTGSSTLCLWDGAAWQPAVSGGSGTVTSITAGTGLSGGTITTSGTIALDNTTVTAGSYTYASITVDAQGRLTAASNGVAPNNLCGYTCAGTPFNTALGCGAGVAVNTGICDTLVGHNAGCSVTSGGCNTAIGTNALCSASTTSSNTAIGHAALKAFTGTGATAIGYNALCNLTTGGNNTAIGWQAGMGVTAGAGNVFIGLNAGATGDKAQSVGVGYAVLQSTTGGCNTAIGYSSQGAGSGSHNTSIGRFNIVNSTTGAGNVTVGSDAGCCITTGSCNSFLGRCAGVLTTTGCCNTLLGAFAGSAITTGGCNTIVGGYIGTTALTSNVVLADGAGNIKLQVNGSGALGVGTTPSYGTTGQILVSAGTAAAPAWTSSGSVPANYGSFVRTTTQANADTTNGNAVSFDTTVSSNNFSVVSGTQITATVAGTYSVIAAFQAQKTDAGADDIRFWFKKNGSNIANSGFNLTLQGNNSAQLATTPWIVTLVAGDYIEAWWYSVDVNIQLLADPAAAPYPAIPAAGLTIQPVGA